MKRRTKTPAPRTALELQALVVQHLTAAIQALQDDGVEVVLIGVQQGDPLGGPVGIAGTVHPAQVRGIVATAYHEICIDRVQQAKASRCTKN
jgi:hypothetical protein